MPAPCRTQRRNVIYIHGPQASGKTTLALELLRAGSTDMALFDDFFGARLPRGHSIIVCSQSAPRAAWLKHITKVISLEAASRKASGRTCTSGDSTSAHSRP